MARHADAAGLGARGVYAKLALVDRGVCARVRSAMDDGAVEAAEVYVDGYVVDENVRRTLDVSVDSETIRFIERTLDKVRLEVSNFFALPLSAAEGPGFLRYVPSGFYRSHRDVGGGTGDAFPRRVSLVLFLTDAAQGRAPETGYCEGGSLRLWAADSEGEAEPIDIPPAAGTLIAFKSDLLHEVLPVTAGVRDVVVDWFY